MSFRSNSLCAALQSEVEEYFTRNLKPEEQKKALLSLRSLYDVLGPPIKGYPTWHPIVRNQSPLQGEDALPSERNGWKGLDHIRYFRNGFISCPSGASKVKDILDSVEKINNTTWKIWDDKELNLPIVRLKAERLNFNLYTSTATPVMVLCDLDGLLEEDGTIDIQTVFALFFQHEAPAWRNAECAESWETMRPYFLGRPCGARSSLFVNQKTGQALKTVYNTIVNSGASGNLVKLPTKVRVAS